MTCTALYRHFDADGVLLYVGISLAPINRLDAHMDTSSWVDSIARVDVEWHDTRELALKAERAAIATENPRFNKNHSAEQGTVAGLLGMAGSRDEIAAECRVAPIAVYRWSKSGSIPSKHLCGVLRVAKRNKANVTAEMLCEAHDTASPQTQAGAAQ